MARDYPTLVNEYSYETETVPFLGKNIPVLPTLADATDRIEQDIDDILSAVHMMNTKFGIGMASLGMEAMKTHVLQEAGLIVWQKGGFWLTRDGLRQVQTRKGK